MKSLFSNLSQAQAMLLVGIITVVIGGIVTGYFQIRQAQIPIEATSTAETRKLVRLTAEAKQTVQAELTVTAQVSSTLISTPTLTSTLKPTHTPVSVMLTSELDLACAVLLRGGFEYLWKTNEVIQQQLGCPIQSEVLGKAGEQHFQYGKMYWSSTNDYIYVLNGVTGTWSRYKNAYEEGEHLEALNPPEGFYAPEQGFRKLWQDRPQVQDELGWATRPFVEMSDTSQLGAYQSFRGGIMLYSWGLDGHECKIYVLFDDNTFVSFHDIRGPGC